MHQRHLDVFSALDPHGLAFAMKYCNVCNKQFDDTVTFCPTDGEVLEDDPSTIVGSTLDGQYHVEAMLGKGGMGAVYSARHILLGDRVAIKVLPPQMRSNAEWLRRFRREGQAARRFRHPNAVTVYDMRTTSDGLVYMVMELVEGHTLDAELKQRGRFSPEAALEIVEPVASVLNAAHAMGVVHRDLKPENIMIAKFPSGSQQVKLLDLGIAKLREVAGSEVSGATALTVAGQILGTPYYMSPEQWGEVPADGSSEIDGRADIYSLGAVLYELLAGKKAFMGSTLPELRRQHVSVSPPPLHEVVPGLTEAFGQAVAKAMSKDRGDRQSTADDLAQELREALGRSGASVGQDPRLAAASYQPAGVPPVSESSSSSQAQQTSAMSQPRQTGSSIAAPTIATVETSSDSGSFSGAPVSAPPGRNAASLSAEAAPAVSRPVPPRPAGGKSRAAIVLPVIAIAVIVGLALVGAGGWFVYSRMSAGSEAPEEQSSSAPSAEKDLAPGGAGLVETLRYWLEVEGTDRQSIRAAGVVPLKSGQAFKFHFSPARNGYVYIVGPGPGNVPMTFLTSKPVPESGVSTNEVKAGADFSFPAGATNWIELDRTPGSLVYTMVFSESPLMAPAFLSATAGRMLEAAEQEELRNFLNKNAQTSVTDVTQASATEPYVSIRSPNASSSASVIVFEAKIEHK